MQVLVNGKEVFFDEIEVNASLNEIVRQFTLVDVADKKNYNVGDVVEIFNIAEDLLIEAEIEYINAEVDDNKSEFIYAGRNNAKYINDNHFNKTVQFTNNQKAKSVISEISKNYGIKIDGDVSLPSQDIKTMLIGGKIIDGLIDIAHSAGKILTSDAKGNLKITFEAEEESEDILEFGTNIISRTFMHDTTQMFDKHTIVSQSNYLVEQTQDVFVKGSYGSGKFEKVKVSQNTLTSKECEELAKKEFLKDIRKSLKYTAKINQELSLNKKYSIKDEQLGINEMMNCKSIKIVMKHNELFTIADFERVAK